MSEKRFKSYALFKGKKTVYRDNEAYTNEEVVDLLNKLYEENKKLKHINDQLEERLESSGIGIALKMDCEKYE